MRHIGGQPSCCWGRCWTRTRRSGRWRAERCGTGALCRGGRERRSSRRRRGTGSWSGRWTPCWAGCCGRRGSNRRALPRRDGQHVRGEGLETVTSAGPNGPAPRSPPPRVEALCWLNIKGFGRPSDGAALAPRPRPTAPCAKPRARTTRRVAGSRRGLGGAGGRGAGEGLWGGRNARRRTCHGHVRF